MLKSTVVSALFALVLGFGPAAAQTAPAVSPAGPTAVVPAAPSAAPTNALPTNAPPANATGRDIVAGCRDDAETKGLKGDARRAAVHDCVAAQRPRLAARMDCRQQGKSQGLKDEGLKAFVRECMAKTKI